MRLLLDTNVLIDYFGQRQPSYRDVVSLLVAEAIKDVELWSSAKSYTDVFYILRKEIPSEKIQQMFAASYERIKPCTVDIDVLKLASERAWPDFEDCIVAVCAERVKADYLITRNKKGFKNSNITVLSPREFLNMIEREYGFVYDIVQF